MKAFARRKQGKSRRGCAVLLGDAGHTVAAYSVSGEAGHLDQERPLDPGALMDLSRKGTTLSLCFSPRTIYSDIGEFSSVSPEATSSHIRSNLDKTGLFKEDYDISFIKLDDIDTLRARYSYLAIPRSELSRIELVDGDNAIVECFCPIEAALASALGTVEKSMAILLHEDSRFIRIIAAKDGVIYHLITINAAESFDTVSDTVSGIREAKSLLMNSYRETVKTVYMSGHGEVGREDLQKHGIDSEIFPIGEHGLSEPFNPALFGTALNPRYDFTTRKLRQTRALMDYARISMGISFFMIAIAGLLMALGFMNSSEAQGLQKKFDVEYRRSSAELRKLERDYARISKELDLANINAVVDAYKDFQAEPRLHEIIDAISARVPDAVFITRIEVKRPDTQSTQPAARVERQDGTPVRTTHVDSFEIVIEGVINTPYPLSKEVFTSFITTMQGVYAVKSADYSHKGQHAEFSLDCEMNL